MVNSKEKAVIQKIILFAYLYEYRESCSSHPICSRSVPVYVTALKFCMQVFQMLISPQSFVKKSFIFETLLPEKVFDFIDTDPTVHDLWWG